MIRKSLSQHHDENNTKKPAISNTNKHVQLQNKPQNITIKSKAIICQGQSSKIICAICFDSIIYSNIFKTSSCNHSFCTNCISKYINVQRNKNVVKPNCPDPECSVELKPQHFQSILPKKLIVKWESAIYESSISPTQKSYCPYKNCSVLMVNDSVKDITSCECASCHRLFCAQCEVPWHVNMNCREFQKSKKGLDEKRLDNEFLELAKREKWQKCPKCFMHVQRTTGCEHIHCRCGCDFCYMCGKDWKSGHTCKN